MSLNKFAYDFISEKAKQQGIINSEKSFSEYKNGRSALCFLLRKIATNLGIRDISISLLDEQIAWDEPRDHIPSKFNKLYSSDPPEIKENKDELLEASLASPPSHRYYHLDGETKGRKFRRHTRRNRNYDRMIRYNLSHKGYQTPMIAIDMFYTIQRIARINRRIRTLANKTSEGMLNEQDSN